MPTESTSTPDSPTVERSAGASLRTAVGATAEYLQKSALGHRSDTAERSAKALLASLRRAAGQPAEKFPLEFEQVLAALTIPLHSDLLGRGNAPSPNEQAAFDALTLFAVHGQSMTQPIHTTERSFAHAMGILIQSSQSQSLKPRFDALLAARQHRARVTHLRSLVTLMRANKISFDYGALATDLRTLSGPNRNGTLLRWSRDLTFGPIRDKKASSESDATAASSSNTPS